MGRGGAGSGLPAGQKRTSRSAARLRLLDDAARRLREDPPTCMPTPTCAEACATCVHGGYWYSGADEGDLGAPSGRVTAGLLSALGADESAARTRSGAQAAVLGQAGVPPSCSGRTVCRVAGHGWLRNRHRRGRMRRNRVRDSRAWLPEQRARLGVLLDEAGDAVTCGTAMISWCPPIGRPRLRPSSDSGRVASPERRRR